MSDEVRLNKLEDSLRQTQDSMLLMGKDFHQMNLNISNIAASMKILVELQQDMKVMDERNEGRHMQLREADKLIHTRIDHLALSKKEIELKAENGNRAFKIILYIAKILGLLSITAAFGALLYVLKIKG